MSITPIALDLGGSEMRIQTNATDVVKKSSSYKVIAPTAKAYKDTPNPLDDMLIKVCPIKALNGMRVLKDGAFSMHSGDVQRVDNQHKKHLQDITYINAIHAFSTTLITDNVAPGQNGNVRLMPGVVIPASEFYTPGVDDITTSNLVGNYEVHFPVLGTTIKYSIAKKDLVLAPEGIIGLFPKLKSKNKELLKRGNGILLDPGRITTEVVLIHQFQPDGGSAMSYPIAGSNVESMISNRLTRLNLPATPADVETARTRGIVMKGQTEVPVGSIVQEANKDLAKKLYACIVEVVNAYGSRIPNYNYIAPFGRCFHVHGKPGEDTYTGSLLEELLMLIDLDIAVIDFDTLDEENVRGVFNVLNKKLTGSKAK